MPNLNQTISLNGPGTTTVIPGVAGQIIQVYGVCLVANAATIFTIKSGSTPLTGTITTALGTAIVLPVSGIGDTVWFETAPGDGLVITISGLTGNLAGFMLYKQFEV